MWAAEVATDDVRLPLAFTEEPACLGGEFGLVPGPVLLGQAVFEVGVDQFVGVELGRVRRQEMQLDVVGVGGEPHWNSANTVLHYGKDGALTGPAKEHAETSTLAPHLLQSSLVHINTLLLQQVLAEPAWAKKLTDEDRRGLTVLFWSNINPYGTFRLDMGKRLDLGLSVSVPRPRSPEFASALPG